MTEADTFLSVIVPVYNEAERLPRTLRRLHEYLTAKPFSYEILLVLDGPTDGTRQVVNKISAEISHLRVIDRQANRGKGYTVKEGMLKSSGQIRLFTDADNSTDIAHFDRMLPLFDRGYGVVIASRSPRDAAGAVQAVPQPFYRWLLGRVGNSIVQLLVIRGIWDTHCGFKAFCADAAKRIFAQAVIDGWGFDIEVLALARAMNFRIGKIPAYWINDSRSHMGLRDYVRALGDTIWLKARMRRLRLGR
jgi:dolichyl-phosphate beta-glucosyltransferase